MFGVNQCEKRFSNDAEVLIKIVLRYSGLTPQKQRYSRS